MTDLILSLIASMYFLDLILKYSVSFFNEKLFYIHISNKIFKTNLKFYFSDIKNGFNLAKKITHDNIKLIQKNLDV